MTIDVSTISTLVLGSGGLIASCIAIYMAASTRKKTEADTGKTHAEEKEIENKAAKLSEETYQSRERFWNEQVQNVKDECHREIEVLRDEIGWLKVLIEQHVTWDWEAQRKLSLAGIEHEEPPTLNYIRSKPPNLKQGE